MKILTREGQGVSGKSVASPETWATETGRVSGIQTALARNLTGHRPVTVDALMLRGMADDVPRL